MNEAAVINPVNLIALALLLLLPPLLAVLIDGVNRSLLDVLEPAA